MTVVLAHAVFPADERTAETRPGIKTYSRHREHEMRLGLRRLRRRRRLRLAWGAPGRLLIGGGRLFGVCTLINPTHQFKLHTHKFRSSSPSSDVQRQLAQIWQTPL